MSRNQDDSTVLIEMLRKYPQSREAVIETTFQLLSNSYYTEEDIVIVLESAKGHIGPEADLLLTKYQELAPYNCDGGGGF